MRLACVLALLVVAAASRAAELPTATVSGSYCTSQPLQVVASAELRLPVDVADPVFALDQGGARAVVGRGEASQLLEEQQGQGGAPEVVAALQRLIDGLRPGTGPIDPLRRLPAAATLDAAGQRQRRSEDTAIHALLVEALRSGRAALRDVRGQWVEQARIEFYQAGDVRGRRVMRGGEVLFDHCVGGG